MKVLAYILDLKGWDQDGTQQHAGAEVIYVITGQLVVTIDGDDTVLSEGDSLYFDSGFPHSYRQQGRAICSTVVVVTP